MYLHHVMLIYFNFKVLVSTIISLIIGLSVSIIFSLQPASLLPQASHNAVIVLHLVSSELFIVPISTQTA